MEKMPVLFIGHGSPTNAAEDNAFTRSWETVGKELPRPSAILSVSAHWYTDGLLVCGDAKPRQIYDMYGFPDALYRIRYPAEGSPALAETVHDLAGAAVTQGVWGIDHGTWAVLDRVFPKADIPVVQLSVNADASPEEQYALGEKLSALRSRGILLFGSGSIVHSLPRVRWDMEGGLPWCLSFDQEVKEKITAKEFSSVVHYQSLSSYTPLVFPTPEHFYPLLTVLGASEKSDPVRVFAEGSALGAISMTSYLIG